MAEAAAEGSTEDAMARPGGYLARGKNAPPRAQRPAPAPEPPAPKPERAPPGEYLKQELFRKLDAALQRCLNVTGRWVMPRLNSAAEEPLFRLWQQRHLQELATCMHTNDGHKLADKTAAVTLKQAPGLKPAGTYYASGRGQRSL